MLEEKIEWIEDLYFLPISSNRHEYDGFFFWLLRLFRCHLERLFTNAATTNPNAQRAEVAREGRQPHLLPSLTGKSAKVPTRKAHRTVTRTHLAPSRRHRLTTMPTPSNGISIYAELLSNIRQVSVIASLASASGSGTTADVVENGTVIRVTHGGHTESMALPAPVSVASSLPIPKDPTVHLNWRILASSPITNASSPSTAFSLENQLLPWNAMDLQPASPIQCRKCGQEIVERGVLSSWKDLPSENWAEMMEFWHCHKPHDHGSAKDDEHLAQRGYGASNTISAQSKVGFVDLTSFMLSESDCSRLSVSFTFVLHTSSAMLSLVFGGKEVGLAGCSNEPPQWHRHRYNPPRANLFIAIAIVRWRVVDPCARTLPQLNGFRHATMPPATTSLCFSSR